MWAQENLWQQPGLPQGGICVKFSMAFVYCVLASTGSELNNYPTRIQEKFRHRILKQKS